MIRINFKNNVIALAIGLLAVSCSGSGSNAQQNGGNSETTKAETKSPAQVAGSMETLATGDIPQSWTDGLAAKTGFKNLGKPKGTNEIRPHDWEDGFTVYFYCDKSVDIFAAYSKSVWDLNKTVAEKGEVLLRKYEDGGWKYNPSNNLADAEDDDYRYRWFYSFGGVIWQVSVRANTVGNDKGSIQVTIEKN